MLSLSGHLGSKAAALVDGQLPASVEERAWAHVHTCPGCRQLVEHEAWTKQRLGSLATGHDDRPVPSYPGVDSASGDPLAPPPSLLESLQSVDDWAATPVAPGQGSSRRVGLVAVGGGAIAASVLGLVAVTGGVVVRGDVPVRPSPASIRGEQPQRGAGVGSGTVGTPLGAETNTSAVWARRSR
ncbi:hypothetical protein ASG49_11400 [Marmoricola sp. Leaf446]|uniref:hypothetical protein n=1 Tax=Marmoricola sp. Leaf446 TaxID=1736379 RepID=UPI0006FBC9E0|nr:hypothetical protein [Marmoricola sp. Leaf446]KQT91604.1 hypothetical protein ASG49_11400 [Marmoricola sp. Leaf446]